MSKITDLSKTVVALATALGAGSIAVLRISGKDAITIVNRIFKNKDLESVAANTIHYGFIEYKGIQIDEVLVSVFNAPNSYTGENYVEISCHGSPVIVDEIISVLIHLGAAPAKPGEFTLRAFLNGKIDLSQAEAIASIIAAKSKTSARNSLQQLNGGITAKIQVLKQKLVDIMGLIEIDLDFAEENIAVAPQNTIVDQLQQLNNEMRKLANSFNYAKILDASLSLAIIGEPNVGKSTLMNAMLGENRAITSPIPGTTRDTIAENLHLGDVLIKIVDTAGLRTTSDAIEGEGVKRTTSQAAVSDIILLVVDVSETLPAASFRLIQDIAAKQNGKTILVANKKDLGVDSITAKKMAGLNLPAVSLSAKNGTGLDALKKIILEKISKGYEKYQDEIVITSSRQKQILEKAIKHVSAAKKTIRGMIGYEFAAVDLRETLAILGEISGETVTDDILNNIFSNFCIGK